MLQADLSRGSQNLGDSNETVSSRREDEAPFHQVAAMVLGLAKPSTVLTQPNGSSICSRLIMLMRQPDGAWSASQLRIGDRVVLGYMRRAPACDIRDSTGRRTSETEDCTQAAPSLHQHALRPTPYRTPGAEALGAGPLSHHHHAGHPGFAMTRDQARELVLAGRGESPQ